ncbi:membrane protein [Cnuella takakiae]|uniref:Membrane protein n=1 Tax=Cnuella takakiae TaxID=1302690 RepID=A0A1M5FJY4_9BACT|nr:YihY/virulence factor BrkB family protein [Cnuella takakiae]OLY93742.1 ribonuclease BN [Cnuella takakiae]SHF91764.1 membrane protein [Cnuella takakiae]
MVQKDKSKRFNLTGLWHILKKSFAGFGEDKVPKLSASLAYYTIFSLGPLILVIISLAGVFLGREAIEGSIFNQLRGFVGADAAAQIQQIVKSASLSGKSTTAATIGVITLLVGATSVFAEIQDSINTIWGLKAKPGKQGVLIMLKNRLLSFGVIGSLGFLLLVSLAVTAIIEGLNERLLARFPDVSIILMYVINLVITLGVITLLFAVIFKVLPDAAIRWRDVWAGSIATAILFMIGKFAIGLYIGKSEVGSTYGTAGSLVVLILWVYYSAIILYFGAEFTKAYALEYGSDIRPNKYAVVVQAVTVEGGQQSLRSHARSMENAKTSGSLTLPKAEPLNQPAPEPEGMGSAETLRSLAVLAVSRLVGWTKERH